MQPTIGRGTGRIGPLVISKQATHPSGVIQKIAPRVDSQVLGLVHCSVLRPAYYSPKAPARTPLRPGAVSFGHSQMQIGHPESARLRRPYFVLGLTPIVYERGEATLRRVNGQNGPLRNST